MPFARGERDGEPHRALFWRSGHYQVARVDGWKLQVNERPPGSSVALRPARAIPTEQTNLAAREPERVAELRRALDAHDAEQVEPSLAGAGRDAGLASTRRWPTPEAEDDEYIYWPN